MKKVFLFFGAVFFALAIAAVAAAVYAAVKGAAFDKESLAYVEKTVPILVAEWDVQALLDRASPELKQAVGKEEMEKLYAMFRRLGKLAALESPRGGSNATVTNKGRQITAAYAVNGLFEGGPAVVKISLIKHGETWQILGLYIDSKLFLVP